MDKKTKKLIPKTEQKTATQKVNYLPIAVIGIVLLMGVGVFIFARFWQTKSNTEPRAAVRGSQTDYAPIYYVSTPNLVSLVPCSDCIAVVEKNEIVYINKDGVKLAGSDHNYSDPRTAVYDMELLLYDRGANAYRIEKNASVYETYTANGEILTAAVGKKGNYAIATLNDGGFRSKLYVYDASGKILFEWGSAHDYISCIALSDNGQYAAVALLGSENAVSYTRLYMFDFTNSDPFFTYNYKNVNCIGLDFMHGRELVMLTDSTVVHINNEKQNTWMEYTPSSLLAVAVCHAKRVSVLTSGVDGSVNLNAWDKNGKAVLSVSAAAPLDHLSASDGYYCLADSVSGFVCSETGEQTADFDIPGMITFCIAGKRVFAATEKGIFCYPLHTVRNQTLYLTKTDSPQTKSEKIQPEKTAEITAEPTESDGDAVG